MDFNFSVNALFKEKLCKVKNNLVPDNYVPDKRGDGDVVAKVSTVLDKMGVVSAKAQNLPFAITSAAKLRNSDHVIYILTDPEGNRGHGSVVGILKVGRKKLFIYDLSGHQFEMEPLCVLDFYIHESKQRQGCGRNLFDHMLKDQNIEPDHLALDQPSESFLAFMCKHYRLNSILPQNNSFVVYENFLEGRGGKSSASNSTNVHSRQGNRSSAPTVNAVASSMGSATTLPTYGRHCAKKAGCTMAEYMRDSSSAPQNGARQASQSTNQSKGDFKTNIPSHEPKQQENMNFNGIDSQARPTTLPTKLNGQEYACQPDYGPDVTDAAVNDDEESNGTAATTPEEVPGKLDLKFHHTHLCKHSPDLWTSNHSVPLAQYGHYWSTVGDLLNEKDEDYDSAVHVNGDSSGQRKRSVSNVPLGDETDGESDELSGMVTAMDSYGNGSRGVRDVRIKKTMFQNLSPYRK